MRFSEFLVGLRLMNSSCVFQNPRRNGAAMGSHEASCVRKYAADVIGDDAREAVLVWGHSLECWGHTLQ